MPEWLIALLTLLTGILLLWIALAVFLWVQQRRAGNRVDWRDIARLAPDIVRLIKRLAGDRDVSRATRIWLVALMVYLLLPIDLIPDFIPVIGYADDAIIAAVALRYAVRHAGIPAIERNWPGSDAGLRSLLSLVRPGRAAPKPQHPGGTHAE